MIMLKLYALVSDDGLRLYEIDANSLRRGYALANTKPSTIHWGHADAEKIRQRIIEQAGDISLEIESVQIGPLAKLVQWDIDTGEAIEITDFEVPKEAPNGN